MTKIVDRAEAMLYNIIIKKKQKTEILKMKLNFIVTTLNGYVIERVEIGDYTKESSNEILDKLYSEEFTSKHIGEFNYIDDVAGNADDY